MESEMMIDHAIPRSEENNKSYLNSITRRTGFLSSILLLSCFLVSVVYFSCKSSTSSRDAVSFLGPTRLGKLISDQSSPSLKAPKFKVVVCSGVSSENPFLLEWIEFHRLQGVDKFVLYHESIPSQPKRVESALELEWLAIFYRNAEKRRRHKNGEDPGKPFEDIVELYPATSLISDSWVHVKQLDHPTDTYNRLIQNAILHDCIERFRDRSDYVVNINVDEFLYPVKHETIWDYMKSRKPQGRWVSGAYQPAIAYSLPTLHFGSSGMLWDIHNFWTTHTIPWGMYGHYDPRDSSLFQLFQKIKPESKMSSLELAQQLDTFRTSRLTEQSAFPTQSKDQFIKLFRDRLLRDFPANASEVPFIDSIPLPTFTAADSTDSPLKELGDYIYELVVKIEDARKKPHITNTTTNGKLQEYLNSYEYYINHTALFYPLVIEEQLRRAPSEVTGLDTKGTAIKIINEIYPICKIPEKERKKFLLEKEGVATDTSDANMLLYSRFCNSQISEVIPDNNRVIYDTSAMVANPPPVQLQECLQISAADCYYKMFGGYLEVINNPHEIRLDRHEYRSYQSRTLNNPTWNGDPIGLSAGLNFTVLQKYFGSIMDTGKIKFIPKLHERLAQLQVLAKSPDYIWNEEKNKEGNKEISIDKYPVTRKCSGVELLGQLKVMCPSDFPYVGYYYPSQAVIYGVPFTWCCSFPLPHYDYPWYTGFVPRRNATAEKDETEQVLFKRYTVLCPTYESIQCCDYDSKLEPFQPVNVEV